jgi:predicted dehydrogenase
MVGTMTYLHNNFRLPGVRSRLGVIGLGMVSQLVHLPAVYKTYGLELVAIADLDEALASRVARRYGVKQVYPIHAPLLSCPDVDAIVVITHRNVTASIVRDALQCGKHVLSEKPMAMTLATAGELVDLARQKGVVYCVGFMKRYDVGVARAQSLLAELSSSRRLGRLLHVRGKNFCAEYVGYCEDYIRGDKVTAVLPAPTFPMTPEWLLPKLARKYDWFANVGLHSINLLRYLLNDALSLRHADFSYEQSASVMFDAAGVPVSVDFGHSATGKWEESFEFFFERGRLELQLTSLKQRDRCAAVTLDENVDEAKTTYWGHDTREPWCFTQQMQAFADAIQGNTAALLTSGEDCLRDMELLEEIFLYVQGGKYD